MPSLPLITHPRADSVIAWREGRPVTAAHFLADVARLGSSLPAGAHMLNACSDRYRFAVGLAAALCHDKICLLPSTHTPEVIRQLLEFAPDAFCLSDSRDCTIALPRLDYPAQSDIALGAADKRPWATVVPQIDCARTVAYVFTSGSTGVPVPHKKTWGALVRNVQAGAQSAGLNDGRQHAVIGTVPPQHMYGFESTILIVLQSANALVAGRSFYPVDIAVAINSVSRPRALVSTPVHMRALLGAGLPDRLGHLAALAQAGRGTGDRAAGAAAGNLRQHRDRPDRHAPVDANTGMDPVPRRAPEPRSRYHLGFGRSCRTADRHERRAGIDH